jgi:hypothetical protein
MGQLGDLAKKTEAGRTAAEKAALDGLKKVTIVGGAKTPEQIAHEEGVKRGEDAAERSRQSAARRARVKSGTLR